MKNLVYTIPTALAVVSSCLVQQANAFQPQAVNLCRKNTSLHVQTTPSTSGAGFGKVEEHEKKSKDPMEMDPDEIKDALLDLLPRMKGTSEEFIKVEAYVNALEDKFVQPQTLDFFNLAVAGEWQFLFTTHQLGRPSPLLRLTELIQKIEVNGLDGVLCNQAAWDFAQAEGGGTGTFDVCGSFASKLSYNINQGARMTINADHDMTIRLGSGSNVPNDPEGLVGLIHRAMPTEMFDASNLAMDTTYLDTGKFNLLLLMLYHSVGT